MKITLTKAVTLGSLCALLAGTATATFAQDNGRYDQNGSQGGYGQHQYGQHQNDQNQYGQGGQFGDNRYRNSDQYRHANQAERRRLDRLHAAYAHAATHGNYNAAERAHQHAQAIRAHMRDQHQGNYQGDQGSDQGDQHQHDNH